MNKHPSIDALYKKYVNSQTRSLHNIKNPVAVYIKAGPIF